MQWPSRATGWSPGQGLDAEDGLPSGTAADFRDKIIGGVLEGAAELADVRDRRGRNAAFTKSFLAGSGHRQAS